ncbi:MAG: EAL domain-containing protein [Proteobacteria bacterium]|uniref:bifunctional diguanylate cyclase/phosphodiesterase n=1 Tax=Aquabacterium sp. TaxID=1872578 RepID=UPI0035C71300|nr:EAL domain-containing protein [Pseudomonadota bacterium]
MQSEFHETQQESLRWKQASWLVLLAGALLSGLSWWHAGQGVQKDADAAFAADAREFTLHLDQLVDHHLDVLISFQSMFAVTGQVSRKTFTAHYRTLHAESEYPALLAIQYAPRVPQAGKAALEAQVRNDRSLQPEGYPDFRIHPEGDRAEYQPIIFIEPMARNRSAFGFDPAHSPAHREVMDLARDSGELQVSPPIRLVQGGQGLVVRLPVYRDGARPESISDRRAAYQGLVSGAIRISDLIAQAQGPSYWGSRHLRIEDAQAREHLLFDSGSLSGALPSPASADGRDTQTHTLQIASRTWRLTFTRPPVHPLFKPYPLAVLMGGLGCTVVLCLMMRGAAGRHAHAAELAQRLSQQARDSEHRLRSVVDHTIDGILTVAPTGRILSVNQAVCRMFGHSEATMVGQHLSLLLPGAGAQEAGHRVENFLASQRVGMDGLGRHTEGMRAGGQTFPVELSISTMELDGHKQYIAVVRDLSAQQAAELAVMEAHRQLNEVDEMRRVIVHNAPYAIFVLSTQGVVQTVNPAGEHLLGYKAHQLVGRCSIERFFDPDQVEERARLLSMRLGQTVQTLDVLNHVAQSSPGLAAEWTLVRQDGSSLLAELLITEMSSEYGLQTGYLVMAHDVTSRRDAENQVQHMAMHDALTGLPNRNMLQEQLKHSLAAAEREGHFMAMMFLDLDRFKKINDSLGHHLGDSVLIEVARRLRQAMRTSDIVARLGGDEFVILLPCITAIEDGERVAQKVMEQFAEPLRLGAHELRVTPSIGLALYPQHGSDAVTLMRHADLAMYQAKSKGRNRVQVFSDQLATVSPDTLVLENDLYKALERDELRLHFQPQFDCRTGHITGAEALLRWEHGGRLVPPSDFIPLAEETGLIVPMGEWVLRRACAMAQQWRQQSGWPLRMAVNLSAVQLEQTDLIATVARALEDTGLPATALELEITESVVVRESLRAADVLGELRALGVGIAIDDFGVGYSSFAYLRELPVDRFKLDRSFLGAVPQSGGDSRLVAALIAMGHRLEVGIVAEGVETQAQADFLKAHGCDEAQGYHLGRPMNEAAFEALLTAHSAIHLASLPFGATASPESLPTQA